MISYLENVVLLLIYIFSVDEEKIIVNDLKNPKLATSIYCYYLQWLGLHSKSGHGAGISSNDRKSRRLLGGLESLAGYGRWEQAVRVGGMKQFFIFFIFYGCIGHV